MKLQFPFNRKIFLCLFLGPLASTVSGTDCTRPPGACSPPAVQQPQRQNPGASGRFLTFLLLRTARPRRSKQ